MRIGISMFHVKRKIFPSHRCVNVSRETSPPIKIENGFSQKVSREIGDRVKIEKNVRKLIMSAPIF